MNARAIAFWDNTRDAVLLVLAFALPLIFYFKTYDPELAKEATLLAGVSLLWFSVAARGIEAGRFEWPANRTAMTILSKSLVGWALISLLFLTQPLLSAWTVAMFIAGIALYMFVMVGPASAGFAAKLSWAISGASIFAVLYALAQYLGLDPLPWGELSTHPSSTLIHPATLGVFCASAFPLALSLALDKNYSTALKGLAAASAMASALTAGLIFLGSSTFAITGLSGLHISFTPTAIGRVGTAWTWLLILISLFFSIRDAARRRKEGDSRVAALMFGQITGAIVLLFGFLLGRIEDSAGVFPLFWLLLGSTTGLAFERGGATAAAVAIPAGPIVRRFLYIPGCAIAGAGLFASLAVMTSDCNHNTAIHLAANNKNAEAIVKFDEVALWHPEGLHSRYLAANIIASEKSGTALESALARYKEIETFAPHYRRMDYRKGAALAKLHRRPEAEKSLLASVKVLPNDAETYRLLVEVSTDLGKTKQAHEAALALVRIAPEDAAGWHILAEQYQQRGRGDLARKMLERAAKVQDLAQAGLK
jgi:tetratricopeptide (TPR) repeat protein